MSKNGPTKKIRFFPVRGCPKMTSAFDIRRPDLSPPPYLSATRPKWSHKFGFKPRPPVLGRQLFPIPSPYPLADVILGWPLSRFFFISLPHILQFFSVELFKTQWCVFSRLQRSATGGFLNPVRAFSLALFQDTVWSTHYVCRLLHSFLNNRVFQIIHFSGTKNRVFV